MNTFLSRYQRGDHVWEWTASTGILLMVLGGLIVGAATVATIAVSWLMGFCLVAGGIAQLFHTYRFTSYQNPIIRYLIAAVSVIAGVVVLRSPLVGAVGITLALAVYLFFSAVTKAALAFEADEMPGRGWLILSSVVSFFLGICLFVTFPITSWVIPGTLLGVDFIFYGLSMLVLARRVRRGKVAFESATKLRRVA
jgi:uncharacterized membrane protein HdeD (DUF308 family)